MSNKRKTNTERLNIVQSQIEDIQNEICTIHNLMRGLAFAMIVSLTLFALYVFNK